LKIGYYNISDMNATDALQFIEDYSSTTIDGYNSRQSIFNNIDIRRKIFGIKTAKIKNAMERNEQVVKFNKIYWGEGINDVFESYIQRSFIDDFYRVEGVSIRPMWATIDRLDSYMYKIHIGGEGDHWSEYLEIGHDDYVSGY
jgi:hypothetical protein